LSAVSKGKTSFFYVFSKRERSIKRRICHILKIFCQSCAIFGRKNRLFPFNLQEKIKNLQKPIDF
jgi:hypothetical protein